MQLTRPTTYFPGSEPSQILLRSFSNDDEVANTGYHLHEPLDASNRAQKIACSMTEPFQQYRRRYRLVYEPNPEAKITVARKKGRLFAIKEIQRKQRVINMSATDLHQIPHSYLQHVHEIFLVNDSYFIVSEHEAITLWEIVRCPILPAEAVLSLIVSQVSTSIR